jgi:hypothetical protein
MLSAIKRLAIAWAWIFAVGSLGALGFIMSMRGSHFTGNSTIMSLTVNGQTYHAPWFHYTGRAGTVMLYAEAALALAALVMSVLPGVAIRRIGHGALITWSLMWLVMPVWFLWKDPNRSTEWIALSIVFAASLLATVVRAAASWNYSSGQLTERAVTLEQDVIRWLHRSVIVLAWTFLIASLVPLTFLLVATKGWVGHGDATVFQTTTNGRTFSAWGLHYYGLGGSLLLWCEFLGVIAALYVSTLRHAALRRAALIALLAWSLLLLGNAWWLRSAASWDVLPGAAVGVTAGFFCVLYLVVARWGRSPRQAAQDDLAPDPIDQEHVVPLRRA